MKPRTPTLRDRFRLRAKRELVTLRADLGEAAFCLRFGVAEFDLKGSRQAQDPLAPRLLQEGCG